MHHLLHHFWIAFAFVRHPAAALLALVVAGVIGLFLPRRG